MARRPTSAVGVHVFGPRGSGVEHFLGKEGVTGSNPVVGSRLWYLQFQMMPARLRR